jgi:hypothetical protein
LFGILFPFLAARFLFLAYDLVFKTIFNYHQVSVFPIIQSIISTLVLSLGSFFTLISWEGNAISLTFLVLIIVFILGSPNIQHIKGSQIEIEVRPPPIFELTPSLIEKKLKNLKY